MDIHYEPTIETKLKTKSIIDLESKPESILESKPESILESKPESILESKPKSIIDSKMVESKLDSEMEYKPLGIKPFDFKSIKFKLPKEFKIIKTKPKIDLEPKPKKKYKLKSKPIETKSFETELIKTTPIGFSEVKNITKENFEMYLEGKSTEIGNLTKSHYLYAFDKFIEVREKAKEMDEETKIGLFIRKHSPTDEKGHSILNPLNRGFLVRFYKCFNHLNINKEENIPKAVRKQTLDKQKFITKEDIDFIIAGTSEKISLFIKLYFETGLRRNELIYTKTENIDFENRTIKGIGKKGKPFEVLFSKESATLLRNYFKHSLNDLYPFQFAKPYKQPEHKIWREIKAECEKIGFKGIHPHMFRHALGYYLRVSKIADLEQIRRILRHSDIRNTQIYTESTKNETDKIIKENLFGEKED